MHLDADEYPLVTPDGDSSSLHLSPSSPSSLTSSLSPRSASRGTPPIVPALLRLSWDVAQYLDFDDSSSLHLLPSSLLSSTPSLPPHSASREACPSAEGIGADHRPPNHGRSSEKDSEGERGTTRAFTIAAAPVVVVVVIPV